MPSKLKSSQFSVLCRPLLTATFVLILKQYPRQITGGHDARCRWRNMRTIKFVKGYDSPFSLFHYPFPRQPRSQVLSPTRLSLRRDGWEINPRNEVVSTPATKATDSLIRQWPTANVAERKSAAYEIPLNSDNKPYLTIPLRKEKFPVSNSCTTVKSWPATPIQNYF